MTIIPGTKYAEGNLSGRTGQLPMSEPDSGGGQQIASAIGQLGGVLMDYALNVQKKQMVAEISQRQREIDEAGWAASEAVTGDDEADKAVWDKFTQDSQRIAISSKYKDVNELLKQHLNNVIPNWQHAFHTRSLGIQSANASNQLKLEWSKKLEYGDVEGAKKIADNALKLKAITQAEYDNMIKEAPSESKLLQAERMFLSGEQNQMDEAQSELEKLKPDDLTRNQLERRASLLKQEKDTNYQKKLKFFSDAIMKLQQGELTADDVLNISDSVLPKDDKLNFKAWIEGSHKDAPTQTTPNGFELAKNTVLALSKGDISTEKALTNLFTARYGGEISKYDEKTDKDKITKWENGEITDKDYQWALEKLKKPYDKAMVNKIEGMISAVVEQGWKVGGWGKTKWEREESTKTVQKILAQNITQDLFDWLDKQKAAGKEPTGKEIYQRLIDAKISNQITMSNKIIQLGMGPRKFEKGQIVERGGKSYKIVDFDTDGMPLVDEVK